MFDTINVKVHRPLTAELADQIEAEKGAYRRNNWFFQISPTLDNNGEFRSALRGQHEPTGIVVRGHNGVVEFVQASLPRALFGSNGRLIRSPGQFLEAERRLNAILDQITTIGKPLWEYVRVDLVLQFRCNIAAFIAAHRHCRHPFIRKETSEYGPRGLKLRGTKFAICFYDKCDEMRLGQGDILRVEIQLKKPKLNEVFGKGEEPLYHIEFWTAYRTYRHLMCMLNPELIPETITFNTLLAHCEAGGFRLPNGLTAMENYKATVSRDTYLARRRQIKGLVLSAAGIDWRKMLPENSLPEDLPDVEEPRV